MQNRAKNKEGSVSDLIETRLDESKSTGTTANLYESTRRASIDLEDNIFDKYYNLNRDDLTHLFLQNDGASSARFSLDD